MRLLGAIVLGAVVAGCALRNNGDMQHRYVLAATPAAPTVAAQRQKATLLIAETTASAFYDTPQIVYSRDPGTRAYYQLSSWTDVPSRRLAELLLDQLDRSEAFTAVVPAASGIRGGLVLATHIEEMYHDASTRPGSARLVLRAELSDAQRRVLVGRRTFTVSVPVASYDATGAVQGLGAATAQAVQEVADWIVAVAPTRPE
jgi:cholesterol transport system auxiliary component